MKMIGYAALAAVLCVSGSALAAQHSKQPIVVTAQTMSVQQWSRAVSQKLSDNMRYPSEVLGFPTPSGLATVRFRCDDTGRPADITLTETSGARQIDRAALRAVSTMKSLPPMPGSLPANQGFRANLIFAASMSDYNRLKSRAVERERQQSARNGDGDQVAALTITSSASAFSQ